MNIHSSYQERPPVPGDLPSEYGELPKFMKNKGEMSPSQPINIYFKDISRGHNFIARCKTVDLLFCCAKHQRMVKARK